MGVDNKTLWELLWDYDPNGLVAVNPDMIVQVVNPTFCKMFNMDADNVIGADLREILHDDVEHFRQAWSMNHAIHNQEKAYLDNTLYVRKVIFPIRSQNIIACILVDLTPEWKRENELKKIRQQTIDEVNKVVDKQMKVAQEIAGLLGETTAQTKVNLLKLVSLLKEK